MKLSNTETNVHYALKQYASLNINNLDKDDKQEIYEVANKFK